MLGAVLLDARAFDRQAVADLQPDDFYSAKHQAIWEAMRELLYDGRPVDIVTLEQRLRVNETFSIAGGIESLGALADTYASSYSATEHARIVAGHSRVRKLQSAMCELAEKASNVDPLLAREFVAEVGARVAELEAGDASGMMTWGGVVQAAIDKAKSRNEGKEKPISWGLASVDAFFDGGMEPGSLYVIGARPGMGKTAFVQCCATASSERGETPMIFQLEMLAQQLGRRAIASRGMISNKSAKTPNTEREWLAMSQARDHFDRLPGQIWARSVELRRSIQMARAWRRRLGKRKPGPIILDYLQLLEMSAQDRREPREQQVALCTRSYKKLAKELEVPVVILCQLNRGVEKRPIAERRPQEQDFRESGAIEQDADVLAGLFRLHRYDKGAPAKSAELVVIKNREGATGTVPLEFEGHFSRFLDAPEFVAQQEQERERSAPGFTYQDR